MKKVQQEMEDSGSTELVASKEHHIFVQKYLVKAQHFTNKEG
jgi:hypothetical protein